MRKFLIIPLFLLLAALFFACAPKETPPAPEKPRPSAAPLTPAPTPEPALPPKPSPGLQPDEVAPEAQLLAAADSAEEAERIAELYGITLVKYRNGLARFHTEEDPRAVIRRGAENGWPELTLNRVSKTS